MKSAQLEEVDVRRFVLRIVFPLIPIALIGIALAQPQAVTPTKTIDELVVELGDGSFPKRERATAELWARGVAAIPALKRAVDDNDPEISKRARSLLDKFAWGILPDTPDDVLTLIRNFQSGASSPKETAESRKKIVDQLLAKGKPGLAAVRAFLIQPLTPEIRAALVQQVSDTIRHEVPRLLFAGKTVEAATLIALHANGTTTEGAADYAAFQVLNGTLDAAIADNVAALKAEQNPPAAKLVLAHLYRASGDWAKARTMAADLPVPPNGIGLVERLREEAGDWNDLAEHLPLESNHPDALRLTYLRMAGKREEFDKGIARVQTAVEDIASREEIKDAAITLLVNNQAPQATELLLTKHMHLGLLAEILILQMRFKEALELSTAHVDDEEQLRDKTDSDLRRARILANIGKRDDAVQIFGRVAQALRDAEAKGRGDADQNSRARRSLIRTEVRVGMRDLAAEHLAMLMPADLELRFVEDHHEPLGEILFGDDSIVAEVLFWVLRDHKIPGQDRGQTMFRVRQLLNSTAPQAAIDEAIKILNDQSLPIPQTILAPGLKDQLRYVNFRVNPNNWSEMRLLTFAAVCRANKRFDDAERAYKAAVDESPVESATTGHRSWAFGTTDQGKPWIELGEFLSDRSRYPDAAEILLEGSKRFTDQPLLLFLSGKALVKAGNVKEGNRRIELSHWVSLGNEKSRGRFLDELVRRGETKAAKRETELVLKACWPRDFHFGNVMNQAGRAAVLSKDWATAERCVQRSLLTMLRTPGVYFVDTAAYLNVPHNTQIYHARGLLAAGKLDEAMARARTCLKVTPGHRELIAGMVDDLDALGKKKEADELFRVGWAAYRKMLDTYPKSPSARNGLAGLAADCRRELDAALTYSTEAVASDPASIAYRETLAEVNFRRADREKALTIMAKLAEEYSRSQTYRRQLVRYKSGDIASSSPEGDDD